MRITINPSFAGLLVLLAVIAAQALFALPTHSHFFDARSAAAEEPAPLHLGFRLTGAGFTEALHPKEARLGSDKLKVDRNADQDFSITKVSAALNLRLWERVSIEGGIARCKAFLGFAESDEESVEESIEFIGEYQQYTFGLGVGIFRNADRTLEFGLGLGIEAMSGEVGPTINSQTTVGQTTLERGDMSAFTPTFDLGMQYRFLMPMAEWGVVIGGGITFFVTEMEFDTPRFLQGETLHLTYETRGVGVSLRGTVGLTYGRFAGALFVEFPSRGAFGLNLSVVI